MDAEELANPTPSGVETLAAFQMLRTLGLMEDLGMEGQRSREDMALVLVRVMRLFADRNLQHKDLWREGGWPDQRLHIHSKSRRLVTETEDIEGSFPSEGYDSVYDLIVYCAMLIINAYEGNNGTGRRLKGFYGFPSGHSIRMDSPITAEECLQMIELEMKKRDGIPT